MRIRSVILATHRWLGLTFSVVLAVAGGTGAIMVWGGTHFFRRAAGRLHTDLALGRPGGLVVLAATVATIALELGGLYLWWARKKMNVRWQSGWRNAVFDLHQVAGVLGMALMLILAVTAVGMSLSSQATREPFADFHTARSFLPLVKALYALGSLCFVVQACTGFLMWFRRQERSG